MVPIINEMNRQCFHQAVQLCLLKALYYAGICSSVACIILCPKLCWHYSPRPIGYNFMNELNMSQTCLYNFYKQAIKVLQTLVLCPDQGKQSGEPS